MAPRRTIKNNKVIFVDLPKKTKNVFISIVFRYGYYDETNQSFGLSHLLEHVLTEKLQKSLVTEEIYGSISDTDTRFDIESTKKRAYRDLENGLKTIFESTPANKSLINKEKARIRIELYEKYNDFYTWTNTKTLEALIRLPFFLKRNRTDQIKNIEDVQPNELQKYHKTLVSSPLIIFISGHKLTPKYKKTLSNIVFKNSKIETTKKRPLEKVVYEKNKNVIVKHPIIDPDYVERSLIFPAFSLANSLSDRFALRFLCQELKRKLDVSLGEIGVYKVGYDYKIRENYGFIRLFSFVPKKQEKNYSKIIFNEIQNILGSLDQKKIKKFQTSRKNLLQKDWYDNTSRIEWVIDDILDFGHIKNPKEIEKELMKVSLTKVKRVAKTIFDKSKMNTLAVKSK